MQQLYTVHQACLITGLPESTIRNWIARRHIKTHKLGRAVYLEHAVVEQLKQRSWA
jgi:excisionase family DNA binding protein